MIVVDLAVGESVVIGVATVQLREKSGRRASLTIDAPRDVLVKRQPAPGDTRVRPVEALEPLKHVEAWPPEVVVP